jgi:Ca2+-binding EF-hand superfamily protein
MNVKNEKLTKEELKHLKTGFTIFKNDKQWFIAINQIFKYLKCLSDNIRVLIYNNYIILTKNEKNKLYLIY